MKNYDMILEYLREYNEAELFYKTYYELQGDCEKRNQFIRDYGMEKIKKKSDRSSPAALPDRRGSVP